MADEDFDGSNASEDMKLDDTIFKLAENYVALQERRSELNEEAKGIRDNGERLGIHPLAFQHAVKVVKMMDKSDRQAYMLSMRRMTKVLTTRESDLFGDEEVQKRDERAQKRREEKSAAMDGKAGAPDPDANPRSDPASGGAGKKRGRPAAAASTLKETVASGDAMIDEVAARRQAQAAAEQEEGARALDRIRNPPPPEPPAEPDAPKSQSEIAAEKRAAAQMN